MRTINQGQQHSLLIFIGTRLKNSGRSCLLHPLAAFYSLTMKFNAVAIAALAGVASASPVEMRQNGGGDGPFGPGVCYPPSLLLKPNTNIWLTCPLLM